MLINSYALTFIDTFSWYTSSTDGETNSCWINKKLNHFRASSQIFFSNSLLQFRRTYPRLLFTSVATFVVTFENYLFLKIDSYLFREIFHRNDRTPVEIKFFILEFVIRNFIYFSTLHMRKYIHIYIYIERV